LQRTTKGTVCYNKLYMESRRFTEEENRIYRKGIEMIRSSLENGLKFDVACEFVKADKELKDMIIDDALKIEIAELHYGNKISLVDVSKKLGVAMDRLLKANDEMMEDVLDTAAEASKRPPGSSMTH
jgi:hypothetical protein